jgi:putative nucleotidyltransferase with HDIG domain
MREEIRRGIREHPLIPPIFDLASQWGDPVYLVGGAIRDLALGATPRDLDFATLRPFEIAQFFAERYNSRVVPLGKEATPTYRIPLNDVCLDWVGLEGGTLGSDLKRRDFTINAIGYDAEEDRIYDPTGGLPDLRDRIIRCASPSAFFDDPVRVLKAFRLYGRLPEFEIEEETLAALADQADGLLDAVPERLQAELERLMQSPRPGSACRIMADAGVLFVLVPELKSIRGLEQNDYHHADVMTHTLETLCNLDGEPPWMAELGLPAPPAPRMGLLRLAALFHDLGKADTKTVGEDGRTHFYGHPKPSADMARMILRRLRFSNQAIEEVADLCLNHLRPLALIKTSPRKTAVRRLIHSMGDRLPLLLALAYADKMAARGRDLEENLADLRALSTEVMFISRAEGERIRHLPKLVDGLEALGILGMTRPGPDLGKALDALMEQQVDGRVTTPGQARAYLEEWAARHLTQRASR